MTYSLFSCNDKFYSDTNSIFDKNYDDLFLVGARGKVIAYRTHKTILRERDSFYDTLSENDRVFLISCLESYDRHLILLPTSLGTCIIITSMFSASRTFLVSVVDFSLEALAIYINSGLFGFVHVSPSINLPKSSEIPAKRLPSDKELSDLDIYCRRLMAAYGTINFEHMSGKSYLDVAMLISTTGASICRYIGCLSKISIDKNLPTSVPDDLINIPFALSLIGALALLLRNASADRSMEITLTHDAEGLKISVASALHPSFSGEDCPVFIHFTGFSNKERILFEHHEEKRLRERMLILNFCPMNKTFSLLGIKVDPELDKEPEETVYEEF